MAGENGADTAVVRQNDPHTLVQRATTSSPSRVAASFEALLAMLACIVCSAMVVSPIRDMVVGYKYEQQVLGAGRVLGVAAGVVLLYARRFRPQLAFSAAVHRVVAR